MDSSSSPRYVLHFQTTAKAAADANALSGFGLARFDLIVDGLAMFLAVLLIATGNVALGVVVFVIALLSLVSARWHPIQRGLIALRFRSLLGQTTDVTIDDDGFRLQNPLGSSFVPWSTVTDVRANSQTVALFRERALLGYVPATAFATSEDQARVVEFARSRIEMASDATDPAEAT